jgi:hypothetical protein
VEGSNFVGGLIGSNDLYCTVSYCYSANGTVSGVSDTGGFAGANSGTITSCFYDTSTTEMTGNSTGVMGGNREFMVTAILTDSAWVNTIWIKANIGSTNNGYPYLIGNEPQ